MATTPDLSVIIPAYNEQTRLAPLLPQVIDYLKNNYPAFELIVVDDGSSDHTSESMRSAIAGEPRAQQISYSPNRGKGYAVRMGVGKSTGKVVLFMDADLSTPLDQVPKILEQLKEADIVIGSRGQAESDIRHKPSIFRRFASFVFDQVKFAMVGLRHFKDTQCGFKAFRGPVARDLFAKSKIDRFMFDVEILYMAQQKKLTVREIPVTWSDMPQSKVRFLEGVYHMFRDLWRIKQLH